MNQTTEPRPTTWTDNDRDTMPFFEYRLQDAVHGRSSEKFPLLQPFAYQQYAGRQEVYLYIFSADGAILKHGICDRKDILDQRDGTEKFHAPEQMLALRLYPNFRAYNERNG